MAESLTTRILLRLGAAATLAFLYAPLVVIGLYAFNAQVTQGWPIQDWSTKWFRVAYEDEAVRQALWLSVQAALLATLVAMVLGTLLSLGVSRYSFFGRETVSFIVILPIALPGIITGLALQTTFQNVGIAFGLLTIVVGHATFCIVVVFNNVAARLRRTSTSFEEASADLGARSLQTFFRVILPLAFPAVVAGSIFTFSLTLGDYIAPGLITSEQFIGTVIYSIRGQALPLAAAYTFVPIAIMVLYLFVARKLGAFENL